MAARVRTPLAAFARVRGAAVRARNAASNLQSTRRTALRVPPDRMPPPPSAFARFGSDSWVVPPVQVVGANHIEIGDGVIVLEDSVLVASGLGDGEARIVIGDRTHLSRAISITCACSVTIGRGVLTSDCVGITDSWGPVGTARGAAPPPAPVVIEDGAYLGCNSVIGPGVRVGAGAFVGEGAVVLSDVPSHTVVYGNPARPVLALDSASREWRQVS